MPIPDAALMARLLGVAAPWAVTDASASTATRTVTVRIERPPPRAGLFSRRVAATARRQLAWDHVALFGWRCRILLVLRDDDVVPDAAWTGEPDQGWTRGLQRLVMDLLLAGATVEQLAVLLNLPFGEVWRWKFRLEQGGLVARGRTQGPSGAAPVPAPPVRATAAADAGVLPEDSPLWTLLLKGRVRIEVRALGLRLLLAKLQREAGAHGDADLHRQAAQELHRYFARHAAALGHERAQLSAAVLDAVVPDAAGQPAAAAPSGWPASATASGWPDETALPDPTDPLWMALLDGSRELDVRVLGLRLLLAKLRTQIRRIGDDEVRMVKLVELHRYFLRNQATLGHEIAQIRAWH